MAQNAKIAALTDELIQSIIIFDPGTNRQAYKRAKDMATRGLRAHQYNRTNQFDVQASFKGLDEKFRVLVRDDLADALQSRINELQGHGNKWIPEHLSLLLQLADRPTQNSQVEALELLRPPTPPSPLTWEQIVADDPYSDEEIWKDIDYAADSSGDEGLIQKNEKKKPSPRASDEDDNYDPESCIVPIRDDMLADMEESQFWNARGEERSEKVEITELQAIRETLFMLAGLRTSLYLTNKQSGSVRINQEYVLSHAMSTTVAHLLSQLAEIGRHLYSLRQWTRRPSSLPLIQTFESVVRQRLADYDSFLAFLQCRHLASEAPVAVSLLELHDEVRRTSAPLLRLARVMLDIEPSLLVNPFVHLETLFQQTVIAQMTLDKDIFEFFSVMFFDCLQPYLKPIRKWMESGELGANDETFFVFENDSSSDLSSLWHDRFMLRRGKGDALRSPEFLQPAAQKIFHTGKSVVLLKELGIYDNLVGSLGPEPSLNHESVCGSSGMPLCPFSELFQVAFDQWIKSKYSLASTVLRSHIFSACGLLNIFNEFEILFLGANGSIFRDFADAIFERMDAEQRGWNDRFLLTELARGTFGTLLQKSNVERIVVRSLRFQTQKRSVQSLGTVLVDYALPWPIMNIIQRSSMPVYQRVFTLLLQAYRAKYLLQHVSLGYINAVTNSRLKQLGVKVRHRLVWFADTLRSYLTETVMGPSTKAMTAAMAKAEDINEMSTIHIRYLTRLQEQALLTKNFKPIHQAIISLLDLSASFSYIFKRDIEGQENVATLNRDRKEFAKPSLSKSSRRKSFMPAMVETESSDSEEVIEQEEIKGNEQHHSNGDGGPQSLLEIDQDFSRLLPFVSAGLRSISRVGEEPAWEMLADKLELNIKKERL